MNYYNHYRADVVPYLPKKYSRVLEIGCGEGKFARHLKHGCDVSGIESVPCIAEIAKSRMNNILVGTYVDVYKKLPDHYFDLIICNDVIEHMPDHDYFFRTIKAKINTPGWIVGSIPNVRHCRNLMNLILFKDWKYCDTGILDRTHLRFFTEKSLKKTFLNHGFVIEAFDGKMCSMRLINRLILYLAIVLSVGHLSDTRYYQFVFRIAYKAF